MAYKFGNESHLLPNLYAMAQRFRAIRGVPVKKKEVQIPEAENLCPYPYIKISDLALLRHQGFRALLSIKDVDSAIQNEFLNCLDSDEKLPLIPQHFDLN